MTCIKVEVDNKNLMKGKKYIMYNIGVKISWKCSLLNDSWSSLNSKAPCTEKARLTASMFVLGIISRDPLPRVDILWRNSWKWIKLLFFKKYQNEVKIKIYNRKYIEKANDEYLCRHVIVWT